MKPRHKRAAIILGGVAAVSLSAYLVLNAFESNLVFFFSPSQVTSGEAPKNRTFRVGGMVKDGSVQRKDLTVTFLVTDTAQEVSVSYTGILPTCFAKAKALSPKASWARTATLRPLKCWPNTMKTICRPKRSTQSIRPKKPSRP